MLVIVFRSNLRPDAKRRDSQEVTGFDYLLANREGSPDRQRPEDPFRILRTGTRYAR
jgi:hypothetical protein